MPVNSRHKLQLLGLCDLPLLYFVTLRKVKDLTIGLKQLKAKIEKIPMHYPPIKMGINTVGII